MGVQIVIVKKYFSLRNISSREMFIVSYTFTKRYSTLENIGFEI
jgi:hypothetical protein